MELRQPEALCVLDDAPKPRVRFLRGWKTGDPIDRDGQQAMIYYAFAEGTVEEQIALRVVGRMAAMDGMAGDDTADLDDIARIIDELAAERNT